MLCKTHHAMNGTPDYCQQAQQEPEGSDGPEPKNTFRFLFASAREATPADNLIARLDALGEAMGRAAPTGDADSDIPAIVTYLGQFIDHDITANTDRDQGGGQSSLDIDRDQLEPLERPDVERQLANLRRGTLDLDSVYGDGPDQSALQHEAESALRDPDDPAKLWLGTAAPFSAQNAGFERPTLPVDNGNDIPRFAQAIDRSILTVVEAAELQGRDGSPGGADFVVRRSALIGDARNDENLLIAQLHLAFLRYHNALVDELRVAGFEGSDEEVFERARRHVVGTYQHIVATTYLRAICDEATVDAVIEEGAPMYQAFFRAHQHDLPDGTRPMPIEFSVAAFRFGHSMVRDQYEFNVNFNSGSPFGPASFEQLFQFTGGGNLGVNGNERLPDNWIIEWDRFIDDARAQRTRKIDTVLAPPLMNLVNVGPGLSGVMQFLATRNLRRGYLLNVPTGQAVIEAMHDDHGISIPALTPEELTSGETGKALAERGLVDETPLWYYILKEAEVRADGQHLGALGSRIVAETLYGLLVTDEHSFFFQNDTHGPPDDLLGQSFDSLEQLLRRAGVLA